MAEDAEKSVEIKFYEVDSWPSPNMKGAKLMATGTIGRLGYIKNVEYNSDYKGELRQELESSLKYYNSIDKITHRVPPPADYKKRYGTFKERYEREFELKKFLEASHEDLFFRLHKIKWEYDLNEVLEISGVAGGIQEPSGLKKPNSK